MTVWKHERRDDVADNENPQNPIIWVTDAGAPEGSVYVHDRQTGMTVLATADESGYCQAIRDLNNFK